MSGQVVTFLCEALGNPVSSPTLFNKIGTAFRRAMVTFAEDNDIPMVRFAKGDRRADVMRPFIEKAMRPGVVATAWLRSSSRCSRATSALPPGIARFGFEKADRRMSVYYVYVWDDDFGPGFIKICSYFPVSDQGVGQRPRAPRGAIETGWR